MNILHLIWPYLVTLLALTTAIGEARSAEVPTFQLEVSCEGKRSYGTGFVVTDWRQPENKQLLLVTALHVVHGCESISVTSVRCNIDGPQRFSDGFNLAPHTLWQIDETTEILLWPERDMAAIVIPPVRIAQLIGDRLPGYIDFSAKWPHLEAKVSITGTNKYNDCQQNLGFVTNYTKVESAFRHIRRHYDSKADAGSLLPTLDLMRYFASEAAGGSGSPVTTDGTLAVLAFHDVGLEGIPIGLAIMFAGTKLSTPTACVCKNRPCACRLGGPWPPDYRRPFFGQSQILDPLKIAGLEKLEKEEEIRFLSYKRQHRLSVGMDVSSNLNPSYGAWSTWRLSPQAILYLDLLSGGALGPNNAFGIHVAVQYAAWFGSRLLLAPDPHQTVLQSIEERRNAFIFEPGIQVRFRRFYRWRPSIDIGVRLGYYWFSAPGDDEETRGNGYVIGFPVRVRLAAILSKRNGIVAALGMTTEYEPTPFYVYTGAAGRLKASEHIWVILPSLGLSYEHEF